MNSQFLEQLLYEDESSTLDFKRDQYRFDGANDVERSEILKDILGFANGWRRSDAYILIGVDEVRGGKSLVVGASNHLEDHTLQQFVNSRTNKPIHFGYRVIAVDGHELGVIQIEKQARPFYLMKDYGKLKRNEVYVRRGSSTDPTKPASPEEIAQMGVDQSSGTGGADVSVEFGKPDVDAKIGSRLQLTAERCRMPEDADVPDNAPRPSSNTFGMDMSVLSEFSGRIQNRDFYREVVAYEFANRWLIPIRFVITNCGKAVANDVRVEIKFVKGSGLVAVCESDFPEYPEESSSRMESNFRAIRNIRPAHFANNPGYTTISDNDDRQKLVVDCKNIQPGREIDSEKLFLGVVESGEYQIDAVVFSENFAEPKICRLTISADISQTNISVDELLELADERY